MGTDAFLAAAGVNAADYPTVSWSKFLLGNLVPVTIGNIIGGALLVGLVYWFVYRLHAEADAPQTRRRSAP